MPIHADQRNDYIGLPQPIEHESIEWLPRNDGLEVVEHALGTEAATQALGELASDGCRVVAAVGDEDAWHSAKPRPGG